MRTVVYVHPIAGLGGATRSLLLLADGVREHGWRPVVVGQQVREGLAEECERLGIPFYPLYLTPWAASDLSWRDVVHIPNRLNTLRRLVRICRSEGASLVHTNLQSCVDGALAARLVGLPHIFHMRETFDPLYRRYFGGTAGGVRFMNSFSDRVIVLSQDTKREFERFGRGDSVRVIHNAVSVRERPSVFDRSVVRSERGLPEDACVVGIIGDIAPRKGHGDFVRALARLVDQYPKVHGLIVGDGERDYVSHVLGEIERAGLSEAITIIGHQADVWPLLWSIDALACPSRAEGFGRILVEGMAAGAPVVGTRVGGIPEVIDDGSTGLLVPPANPERLAEALARALFDEPLRQQLIEGGTSAARELFAPSLHVRRVVQVYEELIGS